MRVVATNTKARYIVVIAGDPVKAKHTGNASTTGTRERQMNCEPVRVVVCNLKVLYTDVTIAAHVSRRHTGNARKGKW